jgi:hypothetical protein
MMLIAADPVAATLRAHHPAGPERGPGAGNPPPPPHLALFSVAAPTAVSRSRCRRPLHRAPPPPETKPTARLLAKAATAAAACLVALLALAATQAAAQASSNVVVQSSLLPRLPAVPGFGRGGRAGPTVVSVDPVTGQTTVVQQQRAVSPGVDVRRDPVTGATVLSTSRLAPLGSNGQLLPPIGGSRPVYVAAGDGRVVQINAPTLLPSLQGAVPAAVNRKAAEVNAALQQMGDRFTAFKNKGQVPAMTTTVTQLGTYAPLLAAASAYPQYYPQAGNKFLDKKNEITSAFTSGLGGGAYGTMAPVYGAPQATQVVTLPANGASVPQYSTTVGYTNNNVVYSNNVAGARLAAPAPGVIPITASPSGWKAPASGCPTVKDAVVVGPNGNPSTVSACTYAVKKELSCASLVKLGQLPSGSVGVRAPDGLSGAAAFPPGAAGCAGAAAAAFALDDKTIAFETAGAAVPALAIIVRAKELGSAAYFFGAEGATAAANLPAFSPGDAIDALWKIACEKFDKHGKCNSLNKDHPGIEGELCYMPAPTAVQVAQTTTYGTSVSPATASWTISKRVRLLNQPPEAAAVAMFRGDAQDALWTIEVGKKGDDQTSAAQAAGSLVISNPSVYPVTLSSINAGVQGGPQATVVCDQPLPIQLDACGAVTCQHVTDFPAIPQPGTLASVAAVQYIGGDAGAYGGGATVTGTTPLSVPPPNAPAGLLTAQGTVQPGQALVTDPQGPDGGAWTFSAGGTASYVTRLECPADSGVVRNEATLTASTGQQARVGAEVQRLCYDLNVRVGRVASQFAGSYQWRVTKAASEAEVVLAPRPPASKLSKPDKVAAALGKKQALDDLKQDVKGMFGLNYKTPGGKTFGSSMDDQTDALSDFLSKLKSAKDALLSPAQSALASKHAASAPSTRDVTYRVTYTRTDPTGFVSGAPAYPVLGDVFIDNPAPLDAPIDRVRIRIGNPSRSGAAFEADARCASPDDGAASAVVPAGGTLQCVFDAQPDFNPAGQQMFATVTLRNTYNGQPAEKTTEFHSLLGTVAAGGVVRRTAAAMVASPATGSAVRQGSRNVASQLSSGASLTAGGRLATPATATSNQAAARMGGAVEVAAPSNGGRGVNGRRLMSADGLGGTWGGSGSGGDSFDGSIAPEFGLGGGGGVLDGGVLPAPMVYAVPTVPSVLAAGGSVIQPSVVPSVGYAASGPGAVRAAQGINAPENGMLGKVQSVQQALAASALDKIAGKEQLKAQLKAPVVQAIQPSAAAAQAMQIAALQAAYASPYAPKQSAAVGRLAAIGNTIQNSLAASLMQDDGSEDAASAFARALDGIDGEPERDAGVFTSNDALSAARALVDPSVAPSVPEPSLQSQPTPAVSKLTDACVDVYDGFAPGSGGGAAVVSGTVPSGRICESRTFVYTVRFGPYDGCFEHKHVNAAGFAGADSTSTTGTATADVRVRVSGCPTPAEATSVSLTAVRVAKAAAAPAGWTVSVDALPSLLLLKKGAAGIAKYSVAVKRVGAASSLGKSAAAAALVGDLALANPSPVAIPLGAVEYAITGLACAAGAAAAPFSGGVACPASAIPAGTGSGAGSPGRLRCTLSAPLPCPGDGKVEIKIKAADGTELFSDAVPFAARESDVALISAQSLADAASGKGAEDDGCATVALTFAKGDGKVAGRAATMVPGRLLSDVGSAVPAATGTRVCSDRVFSFSAAFGGFGDCVQRLAVAKASVFTGKSKGVEAAADEAELPINTIGCPIFGGGGGGGAAAAANADAPASGPGSGPQLPGGGLRPESGTWSGKAATPGSVAASPAGKRIPKAGVNCVVPAFFWAGCRAVGAGDKCAAGWASLPEGRSTPLAGGHGAAPAEQSGVPESYRQAAAAGVADADRSPEAAVKRAAKHLAATRLNLASGAQPPLGGGDELLSVVGALQAFFEQQATRPGSLREVGEEQAAALDGYSRVLKRFNTGGMGVPACGTL